jgi:hypothetical protein
MDTPPPGDLPPQEGEPEEPVAPLWLHIHVNEPWNFEQENGVTSMVGWTTDHADPENEDWEVTLQGVFLLFEEGFDRVLVSPRYIGETMARVVDDFVTAAVRIARLVEDEETCELEWRFVMTGTLAHQREEFED